MRKTSHDISALKRVQPIQVSAYLRTRGWTQVETIGREGAVWRNPALTPETELLQPLTTEIADYVPRTAELVATLAALEGRPELDVLTDFARTALDAVRLTLVSPHLQNSSISLNDGVALYSHARDMLVAAACAVDEPGVASYSRKPRRVVWYSEQATFAPATAGSFVVTLHSPVPEPRGRQPATYSPFERQVIQTLLVASAAAVASADRWRIVGSDDALSEAVQDGVSANLCDAIAGVADSIEAGTITLSVSWSASLPPPVITSRLTFDAAIAPSMREVAAALRKLAESETSERVQLHGRVVRLQREAGRGGGLAMVRVITDSGVRTVRAELDDPSYSVAIRAHATGHFVRLTGLLRRRRSWVMEKVDQLILVEK